MKPEYFLQFLSPDARCVLRWLKTQAEEDRLENIWAHGLLVGELRDRGLAKKVRRPCWTSTVLTKRGEAVLALIESEKSVTLGQS